MSLHLKICGQSLIDSVETTRISHQISIGDSNQKGLDSFRLASLPEHHQLCLSFRDRKTRQRKGAPTKQQVLPLFTWLAAHEDMSGLLVHCGAGMSRSPAVALLTLCFLFPCEDPFEQMFLVERCSEYDSIWPNPLVVELGDEIMQRKGEIIAGVERWRRMKEPD
ncbi:MAG: hypothetical protein AAFX06_30840 [Planctomycetota bacterium]